MTKVVFEAHRLPPLIDILMAAAYADQRLDGREVNAVEGFVQALLTDANELPDTLQQRIHSFYPEHFDLKKAVEQLGELTSPQRRAVLEMLSDLSEVDEEIDLVEDEFLRSVAEAIGADSEEMEGLTVEVELCVDEPKVPTPPPLPKNL